MTSPLNCRSTQRSPHRDDLVIQDRGSVQETHRGDLVVWGTIRGDIVPDPADPDFFERFSAARKQILSLSTDPSQPLGSLGCAMAIGMAQATKPPIPQLQPPPLPEDASVIDSHFPQLVGKHLSDFDNVELTQISPYVRDRFLAHDSEAESDGAHVKPAADAADILAGLATLRLS